MNLILTIYIQLLAAGEFLWILLILIPGTMVVIWLYLFCHFGDMITQKFEHIAYSVYDVKWYTLSLNLQKTLPLVIMQAQKNVFFQGYAGIKCTRELFKKVSNIYHSIFF